MHPRRFPFLLASAFAAATLHAGVVETFDAVGSVTKESPDRDYPECTVAPDPADANNNVLKIEWPNHQGSHIGANITDKRPVLLEEPGKYKITARVNLEQVQDECDGLALRILDSGNETFQVRAPFERRGEPGWQEISWVVDTNNFDFAGTTSWGEQVNGVIDLPVRLLGFATAFRESKTNGGTLFIDDVAVTKLSD